MPRTRKPKQKVTLDVDAAEAISIAASWVVEVGDALEESLDNRREYFENTEKFQTDEEALENLRQIDLSSLEAPDGFEDVRVAFVHGVGRKKGRKVQDAGDLLQSVIEAVDEAYQSKLENYQDKKAEVESLEKLETPTTDEEDELRAAREDLEELGEEPEQPDTSDLETAVNEVGDVDL